MFRVEWTQAALDDLADAWVRADSALRQEITVATHQTDLDLQTDPENCGESRSEGKRVHFVLPLTITFRVDLEQNLVTVHNVRIFRPRKQGGNSA